ncbi:hypothetical protein [Minwuia sp.]|uniref:hypothetical protein n=1 Tax=Minwuia sp. TaxID=2493630 RepID=UPI003A907303
MSLEDQFDPLPVIDAHHHIWDLAGDLRYPWLSSNKHSYQGDNTAIRRTYLPAEYRRDSALHNVVATVFVEAEAHRSQQVAETEWVSAQAGMTRQAPAIAEPDAPAYGARQQEQPPGGTSDGFARREGEWRRCRAGRTAG